MKATVESLVAALTEKQSLLERMVNLLESEQHCIVELDLPGLVNCDVELEEVIVRLTRSTACCRTLVERLASGCGLAGDSPLAAILEQVPPPHRFQLEELRSVLRSAAEGVNRLVSCNRELLQSTLRTVMNSMEFFDRMFNVCTGYGDKGRRETGMAGIRLFCKEV